MNTNDIFGIFIIYTILLNMSIYKYYEFFYIKIINFFYKKIIKQSIISKRIFK